MNNEPNPIGHINWSNAYKYKAFMDAEKLLRDEIHRRRGAKMLIQEFVRDPSDVHFEALYSEIQQRTEQLYIEAYVEGKKDGQENTGGSGGKTPVDGVGR